MFVQGTCYMCSQPMTFNPDRVPSLYGEPLCENCVNIINQGRQAQGRLPIRILPGSYNKED